MTILSSSNGWTIDSSAGSIVAEGSLASGNEGSGRQITFTFTQTPQTLRTVYVQVAPITGQTQDFWDNFWSSKISGEPADQFALSTFVSAAGGVFSVNLNADTYAEGDEQFAVRVYESNIDAAYGYAPLAEAHFTIADDDEPGFAQHVIGSDLTNKLAGGSTADILKGFGGNDTLSGLGGNDKLDGGSGDDVMFGGAGNDTYVVDSRGDRVFETETPKASSDTGGIDTVLSSVTYSLVDTILGRQFIEKLTLTGAGSTSGTGNSLANTLTGNIGNNVLRGLGGNDVIVGGVGADRLYGGDGRDTLTGGAGKDLFVFDTVPIVRDLITDFSHTDGDQVRLSQAVFSGFGYTGTLHANAFWAAAGATSAHDADDRIVYNTTTGVLYYDADGLGGAAAAAIAQFGYTLHPTLVHGDLQFIL